MYHFHEVIQSDNLTLDSLSGGYLPPIALLNSSVDQMMEI